MDYTVAVLNYVYIVVVSFIVTNEVISCWVPLREGPLYYFLKKKNTHEIELS